MGHGGLFTDIVFSQRNRTHVETCKPHGTIGCGRFVGSAVRSLAVFCRCPLHFLFHHGPVSVVGEARMFLRAAGAGACIRSMFAGEGSGGSGRGPTLQVLTRRNGAVHDRPAPPAAKAKNVEEAARYTELKRAVAPGVRMERVASFELGKQRESMAPASGRIGSQAFACGSISRFDVPRGTNGKVRTSSGQMKKARP